MEPKVFTPTMGKETCIYPVSFCLTYRKETFAGFFQMRNRYLVPNVLLPSV